MPAPEIPLDSAIHEVFRILANDSERNRRIARDVMIAYGEGRKILALTERAPRQPSPLPTASAQMTG